MFLRKWHFNFPWVGTASSGTREVQVVGWEKRYSSVPALLTTKSRRRLGREAQLGAVGLP